MQNILIWVRLYVEPRRIGGSERNWTVRDTRTNGSERADRNVLVLGDLTYIRENITYGA